MKVICYMEQNVGKQTQRVCSSSHPFKTVTFRVAMLLSPEVTNVY